MTDETPKPPGKPALRVVRCGTIASDAPDATDAPGAPGATEPTEADRARDFLAYWAEHAVRFAAIVVTAEGVALVSSIENENKVIETSEILALFELGRKSAQVSLEEAYGVEL